KADSSLRLVYVERPHQSYGDERRLGKRYNAEPCSPASDQVNMAEEIVPPFSARNRGTHAQIDNDFPPTARMGLLHLLRGLLDRNYVEWKSVLAELRRIGRKDLDY